MGKGFSLLGFPGHIAFEAENRCSLRVEVRSYHSREAILQGLQAPRSGFAPNAVAAGTARRRNVWLIDLG
jgi:hypothetical protein